MGIIFESICFFVSTGCALYLFRRRIEKGFGLHNVYKEKDAHEKIVLITGGNSGLGKETAKEMVKRDAIVILACRNMESAQEARHELKSVEPTAKIVIMQLDLASLDSIRGFVKEFNQRFDHLDILINNAGVFVPLRKQLKSQDGYEINFATNHLGHFLLTNLLLDSLKRGSRSRIINVTSMLAQTGELNFDDLMMEKVDPKSISDMPSRKKVSPNPYSNSKLAQIYFNRHLATKLSGTGVHTYALCPGWVNTDLGRHMGLSWTKYLLVIPVAFMFMRTPYQGVQTILHCSLAKSCGLETGKLYRNCDIWVPTIKFSDSVEKKLWDASSKLVRLDDNSNSN